MGPSTPGGMLPAQQQQQGAFGNLPPNAQNLQSNMVGLQNAPQNHPGYPQQRQQNQ